MPLKYIHLATKTLSDGNTTQLLNSNTLYPALVFQADLANGGNITLGDSTLDANNSVEYEAGDKLVVGSGDPKPYEGWVRPSDFYARGANGYKIRISALVKVDL